MGISKWLRKRDDAGAFHVQGYAARREAVYEQFFGEPQTVSHEILPLVPDIDVFVYPPGHAGRPFYTLATGGMSDMRMKLDRGIDRSYARREIILYCDMPDEQYIDLVRFMARFPFGNSTWLGHGHTIPNGQPPEPLFENSTLTTILMLGSIVRPDDQLADKVILDGDPVSFLWLVPITTPEPDLKLKQGCDALLDIFDQAHHPVVLDRQRASYVKAMLLRTPPHK
jgi:hypothetical protein